MSGVGPPSGPLGCKDTKGLSRGRRWPVCRICSPKISSLSKSQIYQFTRKLVDSAKLTSLHFLNVSKKGDLFFMNTVFLFLVELSVGVSVNMN